MGIYYQYILANAESKGKHYPVTYSLYSETPEDIETLEQAKCHGWIFQSQYTKKILFS